MNITDIFETLTQSADFPLLTALLLGALVALNPCQLAISVSALSYLSRNTEGKQTIMTKGLLYVIGRSITYSILGWLLTFIVSKGIGITWVQEILGKAESILPYVLIIIGLVFIYRAIHHHHHDGETCHNSGQVIKKNGHFGALILGILLAFAFCPESAILYFGILIPLSSTTGYGILLPILFSITAAIPVIILTALVSSAVRSAKRFEHIFEHFQLWANGVLGVLFIIVGILFFFE